MIISGRELDTFEEWMRQLKKPESCLQKKRYMGSFFYVDPWVNACWLGYNKGLEEKKR